MCAKNITTVHSVANQAVPLKVSQPSVILKCCLHVNSLAVNPLLNLCPLTHLSTVCKQYVLFLSHFKSFQMQVLHLRYF